LPLIAESFSALADSQETLSQHQMKYAGSKNGCGVELWTSRTPFQRAPLTTLSVIGLMHSFGKSLIGEWGGR
jgi:hypothetical protein